MRDHEPTATLTLFVPTLPAGQLQANAYRFPFNIGD